MMDKDKNNILKEKLRKEFLKCLQNNPQGDVVDDLITVLEKDYILMLKEPLYCTDCIHCHNDMMSFTTIPPFYCMQYQKRVYDNNANNCKYYFSGKEQARKSIAGLHNSLTGDLFYE